MERFTDTDSITVKVTTVTKTDLKKRTKRRYPSSRRMTNVSTKYLKNKLHTRQDFFLFLVIFVSLINP